jgi:putative hydrolase of the HAD superfamily
VLRRLIAFDLDDTLYLERHFVKSGFAAVAAYLDAMKMVTAVEFLATAWRLFEEGARGTIFNQALEQLAADFPPERLPELVSVYREHEPNIKPFANSGRLLENLRDRGIITALISDGPERTQRNKLQALELADFFEHIILTGSYGSDWGKPSLRPFVEVMHRGRMEAINCIYIADNPRKDFFAPNRLGWQSIRVRELDGIYHDEIPPQGGEPAKTVESFDLLFDLLLP